MEHVREIDRWLKWWAVLGTVTGYILGNISGGWIAYQAFKSDNVRITSLEGYKEKQDAFNERIVIAIARLKVIVKDLQP